MKYRLTKIINPRLNASRTTYTIEEKRNFFSDWEWVQTIFDDEERAKAEFDKIVNNEPYKVIVLAEKEV